MISWVLAAAVLAGCGGGGSTTIIKSVTGEGPSTTSSTVTSTTTTGSSTTVGAAGEEPSLAAAEATVRQRGYNPVDTSAYDPGASLAAVVGVKKGSGDGTAQRAFFFADGRFIGTDTSDDSSGIRVAYSRPPVIALTYALYDPRDPQCCPSAGATTIPYRWDGERLTPERPIPPSSFSARNSRR